MDEDFEIDIKQSSEGISKNKDTNALTEGK